VQDLKARMYQPTFGCHQVPEARDGERSNLDYLLCSSNLMREEQMDEPDSNFGEESDGRVVRVKINGESTGTSTATPIVQSANRCQD
jgi:hypothetical protein